MGMVGGVMVIVVDLALMGCVPEIEHLKRVGIVCVRARAWASSARR